MTICRANYANAGSRRLPPARYAQAFPITALAFSLDGSRLVAGGRQELTIWNSANGQLIARLQTRAERAYGIAFLTENRIAVAGGRPGQEGDVRIYDLAAPAASTENGVARLNGVSDPHVMIAHLMDTDDSMLCLAVSPDRKMLAAAGCDKLIRVWRSRRSDVAPNSIRRSTCIPIGCSASPSRRTASGS